MKDLVKQCPRYEKCGASMCPLETERLNVLVWYPDDAVCKRIPALDWVLMQRKVARKTRDLDRYFTYGMLKRNCKVAKGILGLNPDKDEASQLKKWLEMHPPKRKLSKLEKKVIAKRFKEYRDKRKK